MNKSRRISGTMIFLTEMNKSRRISRTTIFLIEMVIFMVQKGMSKPKTTQSLEQLEIQPYRNSTLVYTIK